MVELFSLKGLGKLAFPASAGHSIEEIASILVLFPNKDNPKHMARLLFLCFCYLCYIADGLFMSFIDTRLLPLPRGAFGSFQYVIHSLYGIVFIDIGSTRLFLFFLNSKFGKNNVKWYSLVKDLNKNDHPKIFLIAHCLFVELYTTATLLYVANPIIKLFERSLLVDLVVSCIWSINSIFFMRFTVNDVPLVYMIAYCCYFRVKEKMRHLTHSIQVAIETDQTVIFRIFSEYKDLLETVCSVNQLVKVLMLQNSLFIIPYISSLIVITIAHPDNWVQLAIKIAIFVPASVYAIRGIVLTAVLARIDMQSKILYRTISSSIARGRIRHLNSRIRLQRIMDDLSCFRNHLLLREYTGQVTQMDVYDNIIRVIQFTILMLEFGKTFQSISVI